VIRLLLVRHGESAWNREGRVQGQAPGVPLTDTGLAQARRAAALLRGCGATRLVSSDLQRAVETAAVVAEAVGLPVETDADLREQGVGVLEGRYAHELGEEPTPEGAHVHEIRWGGGESIVDVHARVTRFCERLRASAPGETVILVSHGATLQVLRAVVAGLGPLDVSWDPLGNGEVLELTLG